MKKIHAVLLGCAGLVIASSALAAPATEATARRLSWTADASRLHRVAVDAVDPRLHRVGVDAVDPRA